MLPPFDEFGLLPPGIHLCTVSELAARFGSGSEERVVEMSELTEFIQAARAAGALRLLVNGSFVTNKMAPNVVDVVILPAAIDAGDNRSLDGDELVWPFLQIIVAADDADFEEWANIQFATDRKKRPKGVVEVQL